MTSALSAALTFFGFACVLASLYRWGWFWSLGGVGTWLDKQFGRQRARLIVGAVGVLLIYSQVRQAADAFAASFIGQALVLAGGVALIGWAYLQRRR